MAAAPEKSPQNKRRNLGIALFIIGLFLVGTVLLYCLTLAQNQALQGTELAIQPAVVSYAAPALSLTSLDGTAATLADYKGQVVLVNNWATWCPPCKDEMPVLQAYFQAHAQAGFTVVAIESGEPATTVGNYVQSLELTFPVWLDPHGLALDAFKNWDLPSSYVIDRTGTVRMSWTGPVNQTTLEKYVTPLLEK